MHSPLPHGDARITMEIGEDFPRCIARLLSKKAKPLLFKADGAFVLETPVNTALPNTNDKT